MTDVGIIETLKNSSGKKNEKQVWLVTLSVQGIGFSTWACSSSSFQREESDSLCHMDTWNGQ